MKKRRDIPFYHKKPNGKCYWCGKDLSECTFRRLKYCSDKCSTAYYEHFNPRGVRTRLLRERGERCERCGAREPHGYDDHKAGLKPLAVHHKIPIADGGELFPSDDGYELLCPICHGIRHQEINLRKRAETGVTAARQLELPMEDKT